jgi:hypothetical protein
MGIRVKHGSPRAQLSAAVKVGQARAGEQIAKEAMRGASRLQEMQLQMQHQQALKQQDMAMDLQMNEASKLWEIEKMQLRSQGDFAREERKRMRALDEYDAAVKYIDESDYFDDAQKEGLKFKAKFRLLNQGVTDRSIFPEMYERQPTAERPPSPTQRISAMKMLETEQYQEPDWLQRLLPFGKGELSEQDVVQKQILEGIVAGKPNVPGGTIAPDVPKTDYQIGEILIRDGIQYKVTGFAADGMPMIEKL